MYPAACPSEEPILLAFIACPHPRASSRAADFPTRAASSTRSAPAPPKITGMGTRGSLELSPGCALVA